MKKYGVLVKEGPREIQDVEELSGQNNTDSLLTEEEEELLGELEISNEFFLKRNHCRSLWNGGRY